MPLRVTVCPLKALSPGCSSFTDCRSRGADGHTPLSPDRGCRCCWKRTSPAALPPAGRRGRARSSPPARTPHSRGARGCRPPLPPPRAPLAAALFPPVLHGPCGRFRRVSLSRLQAPISHVLGHARGRCRPACGVSARLTSPGQAEGPSQLRHRLTGPPCRGCVCGVRCVRGVCVCARACARAVAATSLWGARVGAAPRGRHTVAVGHAGPHEVWPRTRWGGRHRRARCVLVRAWGARSPWAPMLGS